MEYTRKIWRTQGEYEVHKENVKYTGYINSTCGEYEVNYVVEYGVHKI